MIGTTGLAVSFVDDEEMRSIRVLQDEYGVKIRELPGASRRWVGQNRLEPWLFIVFARHKGYHLFFFFF